MLIPLYPPGHKKAGQRKADKDLTEAERRSQEDQLRHYGMRKRAWAANKVGEYEQAQAILEEAP